MAKADVVVIGGGCMGLGLARGLAGRGRKVALLEAGGVAREASWAAAGMIGAQSEAMEDDAYFAATVVSRDLWPDYARGLAADTGADFGFHPEGGLHLAFGAAYESRLEAKYLWQKTRSGRVERLEKEDLRRRFPFLHPRVSAGYLAHGDYWVDNRALCRALEASCRTLGVEIREGCPAEPLEAEGGRVGRVRAGGAEWEAGDVVVAAGAWSTPLLKGLLQPPPQVSPVKGQMLSFDVPESLLPSVPLHGENLYFVPRRTEEGPKLLVGATVENTGFDKRLTGEGVEYLLQGSFETIPDLRSCAIGEFWAGLRPGASDGWPTLGPTPLKGLHLCCGHYRRGILFLPLTVDSLVQSVLEGSLPEATRPFAYGRHLEGEGRGL